MCSITLILSLINENYALYWAVGIPYIVVYFIVYILLYPVRIYIKYERNKEYFQRHGITRLQYFLGKRVKR